MIYGVGSHGVLAAVNLLAQIYISTMTTITYSTLITVKSFVLLLVIR